jgi:hypothetical protein
VYFGDMQSKAKTVEAYLKELPEERNVIISKLREIILENLPEGYEETIQYGMISYIVPFAIFPDTYNKQPLAYMSLASQKNYISLYMNNIYSDPKLEEWFKSEFEKLGKKLNMGKSCVRFKKLEQLPLDVIGKAVAYTSVEEFIKIYKHTRQTYTKKGK